MFTPPALGWQHDVPDFRDYSVQTPEIQRLLERAPPAEPQLPDNVDLRENFPEACDQRELGASPAHACTGLFEYFEHRAHGRLVTLSRLFLYKNTQLLQGSSGCTAVGIRSTLKAMITYGVPPERLWRYEPDRVSSIPPPHLYAFTEAFRALAYLRLDERNSTGAQTLQAVRSFLAAGFPVAFGFVVPDSISSAAAIPYRPTFDAAYGGQAAIAVGYDDRWIGSTRGALLIRNSWGPSWGEAGYGWLPYVYVEQQLATDFWTLLKENWLMTGEFLCPQTEGSWGSRMDSAVPLG